jgi:hypothetical protein
MNQNYFDDDDEDTNLESLSALMLQIFSYLPPDDQLKTVNREFYTLDADFLLKSERYTNWLILNDQNVDQNAVSFAAENGKLDVVKWLWDEGFQASIQDSNTAATNGHLHIVKWLWDKGVLATFAGANGAAANNQLETVLWLRNQGVHTMW